MSDSTIARRSFVTHLATGAAAVGAASALGCGPTGSTAAASPPAKLDELEQWLATFKGANKCLYDCVQAGGASDGILFARNLLTLSNEKLATTDADMSIIVSFRHLAT